MADRERIKGLAIDIIAMISSYILGVLIRALPTFKYGANLTADDPLLHYRITDYLVRNGHLPTYDPLSWHPWSFNPTEVLPVLHYYTGAVIYRIASLLGFSDLYTVVVYVPVFFAPLVVIPLYLTSKELWGRGGAITSAFAISLSWAYLSRSLAGWYRHEQFAIPLLMCSFYFTLKAMRSSEEWKVVAYSGLSGAFLVYASGIWAGFRALYDGYALIMFLLLLLNRLSWRNALALGIPPLYVLIASLGALPNLAYRRLYVSFESTLVWASLLAALVYLTLPKFGFERRRREVSIAAGLVLLTAFLGLGIYQPLTGRLMRVLFPSVKLPQGNVVETVAEHGAGESFESFTTLLVPASLGLLSMMVERWRREEELTLTVMTFVSLYFAVSMVRLPPLAAPFLALCSGYFTQRLLVFSEPYMRRVRALERSKVRRGSSLPLARKLTMLRVPVLLMILLVVLPVALQGHIREYGGEFSSYVLSYEEAMNYPLGFSEGWKDALSWLKNNSRPDEVAISWWDYGYWLQLGSGSVTLADGLTINSSQITLIAKAFMGPEERMLDLASRFNASYVIVDVPAEVGSFSGGGKWMAMAWIAGHFQYSPYRADEVRKWLAQDMPKFFYYDSVSGRYIPTDYALNTTLYKMALASIGMGRMNYFELVHVGKNQGYVEVAVFRVKGG
ncbi:MAG: STT3 domain-containing protein [Candidatus Korarchaeum sp.]